MFSKQRLARSICPSAPFLVPEQARSAALRCSKKVLRAVTRQQSAENYATQAKTRKITGRSRYLERIKRERERAQRPVLVQRINHDDEDVEPPDEPISKLELTQLYSESCNFEHT